MTQDIERLATLESDVRHIREVVDKIAALTEKVIRLDERMNSHNEDLADLKPRVEALERARWKLVGAATVIPLFISSLAFVLDKASGA